MYKCGEPVLCFVRGCKPLQLLPADHQCLVYAVADQQQQRANAMRGAGQQRIFNDFQCFLVTSRMDQCPAIGDTQSRMQITNLARDP
ncbi:hypothetical protein D3C73_1087720 [compost metagenome]